jgi:hypothetical protein
VEAQRVFPFIIRLATGSITQAQATVLVVNHFNGIPPSGAEAAADAALGGAISRRAARGVLNAHLGSSQFFPAASAPLAANAVLVIGLGEVEKFSPERLPEVAAALVEMMAAFSIRDAATILHGAGGAGVDPRKAACAFTAGLLQALVAVPGAQCFRELTIVELDARRIPAIVQGIQDATGPAAIHVYLDPEVQRLPPAAPPRDEARALPNHLRLGITLAGTQVKVTVIGSGAYDCSSAVDYPPEADRLLNRLATEALGAPAAARANALQDIGAQLYQLFLGSARFDVGARLGEGGGGYLVLRLDEATAHLPWELLYYQGRFLSRSLAVGRQLEIYTPGRSAAVQSSPDRLRVLVVANPSGDLPAAEREGRAVAKLLEDLPGATVEALIGRSRRPLSYQDISSALNAQEYDVLHYAGHADFSPGRGGAGGLRLAGDDLLTPTDLSTRRYLPTLVFANACNSAAMDAISPRSRFGGAEATRDLVKGLLQAGVQAFVGSMWPVDDAAAATFAGAFYTALVGGSGPAAGARQTVGQAMQTARVAVIEEHGASEPTWAAYALYGSPWALGF